MNARTIRWVLAIAILVAALVVRISYIESTPYRAKNDAGTYNRLGSGVAQTGDYEVGDGRHTGAGGSSGRTAYFPPGFPYFLAAVDLIDGHQAGGKKAVQPERVAEAVLGTIAVGVLGMVALEAFGATVALVAMALAAGYPVFIELSGTLVAENLFVVLELAAVWTALRAARSRYPLAWIAATGVFTGLATLTHENGIVIAIPLAFAAARATGKPPPPVTAHNVTRTRMTSAGLLGRVEHRQPQERWLERRGAAAGGVALLAGMLVLTIAPWTIRNAIEMHGFIPVSDETGITLVGTYNPTSAALEPVPYKWRFFWTLPQDAHLVKTAGSYSEPALGDKLESQALHYIGDHPLSPFVVAYHNTLRMFELEGSSAWQSSAYALDISNSTARTGVIAFWVLCLLALAGIVTPAARAAPRWLWWIPVLYALTIVFVNVETPRFREPIDPFLILLAACSLGNMIEWLWDSAKRRRAPI